MSKKIYGSQSTAIASNLSEKIYNKQRQIACVLTCGCLIILSGSGCCDHKQSVREATYHKQREIALCTYRRLWHHPQRLPLRL
jgi:uncharacterized Ntn-hydrolase superfamily protein